MNYCSTLTSLSTILSCSYSSERMGILADNGGAGSDGPLGLLVEYCAGSIVQMVRDRVGLAVRLWGGRLRNVRLELQVETRAGCGASSPLDTPPPPSCAMSTRKSLPTWATSPRTWSDAPSSSSTTRRTSTSSRMSIKLVNPFLLTLSNFLL